MHQFFKLVAQALFLEAGLNARLQQHRVQRLGQVILSTEANAAHDVFQPFERRGHDHRQVLQVRVGLHLLGHRQISQIRVGLELFEHRKAVHLRHFYVEQHEVKRFAPKHVHCGTAIFHECHVVALGLHATREQQPVDFVVFGDQQTRGHLSHGKGPSGRRLREHTLHRVSPPHRGRARGRH